MVIRVCLIIGSLISCYIGCPCIEVALNQWNWPTLIFIVSLIFTVTNRLLLLASYFPLFNIVIVNTQSSLQNNSKFFQLLSIDQSNSFDIYLKMDICSDFRVKKGITFYFTHHFHQQKLYQILNNTKLNKETTWLAFLGSNTTYQILHSPLVFILLERTRCYKNLFLKHIFEFYEIWNKTGQ